jgi:hypothetical protein
MSSDAYLAVGNKLDEVAGNLPLGLRSNNPGNLRPLPRNQTWNGQDGIVTTPAGGAYCRFKTMDDGVRAASKLILNYGRKHNLYTVRGIISRWAPPSDDNHTEAYIAAVCAAVGVKPDDEIDQRAHDILPKIMLAIFRQENGGRWVPSEHLTEEQIFAGCDRALRERVR